VKRKTTILANLSALRWFGVNLDCPGCAR